MKLARNLVVAQSGGPTHVINSSLRGVIEAARDFEAVGTVYGGRHGIEGVLKEELLDLSSQPADEVALLRYTPVAGSIGTCRYKLKSDQPEDFQRCLDVFRAHNVGYFIYIGGNDSMDTANKIAQLAAEQGLALVGLGGPKTIDNDVGDSEFRLIDHTPGYGSAAKYWMHTVQNANEENRGSCPADPVWSCRRWVVPSVLFPPRRDWPTPTGRCRCRSTWPRVPARWNSWPTTSTTNSVATVAAWSWSAKDLTWETSAWCETRSGMRRSAPAIPRSARSW